MKTFTRMIGRYVLATAAVVLLVVGLLLGAVVYLGLHYGEAADSRVRIGTLAEALIPTADGLQLDPARTPADWLQGYAWAMVLDDDGSVIWQHDLPQNLNKHYTARKSPAPEPWQVLLQIHPCEAETQREDPAQYWQWQKAPWRRAEPCCFRPSGAVSSQSY